MSKWTTVVSIHYNISSYFIIAIQNGYIGMTFLKLISSRSIAGFVLEDGFPSKTGNLCDGFPSDKPEKQETFNSSLFSTLRYETRVNLFVW